jgi:hypothetical protein
VLDQPARVYVFDHADARDHADVHSMNQRVTACYAWADKHAIKVLDEVIAWSDCQAGPAGILAEVAAACRRDGAGLLVHSPATLTDHGGLTSDVLASLSPVPVWTVTAAGPVARGRVRDEVS